jgi:hypothetical protein
MTAAMLARIMDIEDSYPLDHTATARLRPRASLRWSCRRSACGATAPTDESDESFVKAAAKVVNDVPGAEEVSWDLANYLAREAQRAWETDLRKESGRLPFTHDMYVKIWALGEPDAAGDFILYDEAQDADPCVAGVVLAPARQATDRRGRRVARPSTAGAAPRTPWRTGPPSTASR